ISRASTPNTIGATRCSPRCSGNGASGASIGPIRARYISVIGWGTFETTAGCSALVYNKGAAVLHMLRRLIGDEAFFRGIRRFYGESRFRKAGTEDLRRAMEAESDRPLERFFERWIYGSTLPRLTFAFHVESSAGRQEVVLHFEQPGDVFDVPVTVTLQYADRRPVDVLVPITD